MSSRCGKCDAEIEWVVTGAGNRMPLELEPGDKPNVHIDADGIAYVLPKGKGEIYGERTSHFVNCPYADEYRKPRATRRVT